MTDGIIFDMDGTLWDSREGVCLAWNEVFKKNGLHKTIDVSELSGYMGMPMDEIAARLFPDKAYEDIREIYEECLNYENEYLRLHGGILYPELGKTLKALSEKYGLFIVSNCQKGYIEAFLEAHELKAFFTDYESYGNTLLQKDGNIRLVVERNGLKSPVYVGDIQADYASAAKAGVDFVHAAYGFGRVEADVPHIQSFNELLELF